MNYSAARRPSTSPMPAKFPARVSTVQTTAYSTQAARYRDAELVSATPGQLVVMLFDKLMLTVRRARIACEAKRIEERCELILKAADMVTELRLSLDFAQGGSIATQLDALYGYMLRALSEANREQDVAKLDVVVRIANDLRDAFAQVVAGTAAQGGAAAALPAARSA